MRVAQVERGVGYLVKRTQQALRRQCDAALRPIGLSMAQYAVLRALHDHPEASASDLARLCFVTRQSLRDVLVGLRSAGLVDDAETSPQGRRRALHLTAHGAKTLRVGHAAVLDVESAMLNGIPAEAHSELAAMLMRCTENLDKLPEV